jgi:hypothetical protein
MFDEDQEDGSALNWAMKHTGVLIGAIGLLAWCALLWFMFGDVL